MIRINDDITIAPWELTESFTRATGPGGQRVNKVATAVELRFAAQNSPNLPAYVKANLKRLAGQKWTKDGEVILRVDTHRSQGQNRDLALERLIALIEKASHRPKRRIKTRPSLRAKAKRMDKKTQRSTVKKLRQKPHTD